MKKTILYAIAAAATAATAAIIIIGCNNGDGGDSAGLNNFIGSFVNRDPGTPDGKYSVNVENGGSPGGGSYAAGETVVIMTDKERDGQRFDGWSSSSAGVNIADPGNTQTYFIMPPNAVTVTANFAPKTKFTVGYDGNGSNGGTVPAAPNPYDSGATVTALGNGDMSKSGYYFSGWSTERDGGRQIGAGETFTITESITLYAKWTPTSATVYQVTVVNGSGGGDYEQGKTVSISATVPSDMKFKNWTSNPAVTFTGADKPTTTFTMPPNAVTVTANFEAIPTYVVTVNSEGAGASGSGSYATGANVTIFAGTPPSGQVFKDWTVNSNNLTLADTKTAITTFTMPANNVTVTANFEQSPPKLQSCNQYCYWGKDGGCAELVVDPSGNYYSNPGAKNPTPHPISSCEEAIKFCDIDGGGRYTNNRCTGTPVVPNPNEKCGVYCIWDDGVCNELITDKNSYYGWPVLTCEEAKNNCASASRDRKTFATMAECKASEYFGKPVLSKSKSASALRAVYSNGAVTATLPPPAASKLTGGGAELIDEQTGSVVSTAPVSISGRDVTAVLPAGANVPAGYYTVRIVLIDRSGDKIIEEASIGIIK